MDKSEVIQDLQGRLDELRNEAEEEGLVVVVSWQDEHGGMQSVQLNQDDQAYVSVRGAV